MFLEQTATMMCKFINSLYMIRFVLLVMVTLFFATAAALVFWTRYIGLNIDYYLMCGWGKLSTLVYGIKRLRVDHMDSTNFVGVYVAPHSSLWDILILGSELKGFFVSKAEVMKWPLIGFGAKMVRTVFLEKQGGISALKAMERSARKIFDSGNSIIIFPEGTRSYDHMKPFKSGAFRLASVTGRSIVPVVITYEPKDNIVQRREISFIKELIKQAMTACKTVVRIELLPEIKPSDFNSVLELKQHVFKVMDEHYKNMSNI